jgi:hypothetical protein
MPVGEPPLESGGWMFNSDRDFIEQTLEFRRRQGRSRLNQRKGRGVNYVEIEKGENVNHDEHQQRKRRYIERVGLAQYTVECLISHMRPGELEYVLSRIPAEAREFMGTIHGGDEPKAREIARHEFGGLGPGRGEAAFILFDRRAINDDIDYTVALEAPWVPSGVPVVLFESDSLEAATNYFDTLRARSKRPDFDETSPF